MFPTFHNSSVAHVITIVAAAREVTENLRTIDSTLFRTALSFVDFIGRVAPSKKSSAKHRAHFIDLIKKYDNDKRTPHGQGNHGLRIEGRYMSSIMRVLHRVDANRWGVHLI
eukprot:734358-Amphidinium_carterae.3